MNLADPASTDRRAARPVVLTTTLRWTLGILNLFFAFAVAVSLGVNIADRVIQGTFNPSHYFHFFTIQTCLINIVVFLIGGIFAVTRRTDPDWYSVLRACTVSWAIVVGVVYNVLLAGIPATDGYVATFEFPNAFQHVWAPIFIAVEWLLMPGRTRLRWSVLWICAVYPLVWVGGSMVRGLVGDGWYPYFFLNPGDMGAGGVALYIVAIAAFIVANCALAVGVGRLHARVFVDAGIDRNRL